MKGLAARERRRGRRPRLLGGLSRSLWALREGSSYPGSKNACEQGECGSCSVLLDGVLVCACLVLAAQADGHDVTTVEGLADGERLHPVQEAFLRAGAVQCGFCTPGLVVAAADLLARAPHPSRAEIREALSGNLCRCTGYRKIFAAVRLAARAGVHAGRLGMNRHETVTKGHLAPGVPAGDTILAGGGWFFPTQGGVYAIGAGFVLRPNGGRPA